MSAARPASLRNRLLLWLAVLHLLAIAATAWFSYVAYGRLVNHFMDDQMHLLAESHANHHRPPVLAPVNRSDALQRGAFIVQLWSADGTQLLASSWPEFSSRAIGLPPVTGFTALQVGGAHDAGWRVYTAPPSAPASAAAPGSASATSASASASASTASDVLRVQVIQSMDFRQDRIVRRALLEGLPILLLLPASLLILWLIVSAVSRSLRAVAHEVAAQDETGSAGLPLVRVPEEIAPLVAAFNSLLGRLRQSLAAQRSFLQEAAHELRTPMAAIGLQLDNLRAHVPRGAAGDRFDQLEAGVQRAQHLIEQLLRLSRHDAPAPPSRAAVDIAMLLRDSVGQLLVLADQRQVDIGFEGRTSVWLAVPAAELRSLFDNLIDNAVRHAAEGGVVDVLLHEVDGQPVVEVIDDGPGIPPALLERVFDRFYRVAGAPAGGSGLGLAIARSVAVRHGLRIELVNRPAHRGLIARVYLPRVPIARSS